MAKDMKKVSETVLPTSPAEYLGETRSIEKADLDIYLVKQLLPFFRSQYLGEADEQIDFSFKLQGLVQPKDEIESLLGAQMVATHEMAMTFLSRAASRDQMTEAVSNNLERANKLLRTFTTQMEALNRHRGKGQQKVTVEHVTVNQGGRAVIGNVERPTGGGGNGEK
jgi:hypothetical protein